MRIRHLALAAASVAALLSAPAQAFTVAATGISGFLPSAGGLAGGTLTGGGFLNGAATRTALTNAAGKIISVPLTLTVGPTASRTIALACFANPALCSVAAVGTGIAAWFLLSKIYQDDAGVYQKDTVIETAGVCWRGLSSGNPCLESPSAAGEAAWVSTYGRTLQYSEESGTSPDGRYKTIRIHWYQPGNGYGFDEVNVARENGMVERTETAPATEYDIDVHITDKPLTTPSTVNDAALNSSPVPVPVESPLFAPVEVPLGEPYKATAPATGYRQDQLKIEGKPSTADPLDLEATPETVVADDPSTPEDESAGETDPEKLEDPCKLRPDTAGCVPLGSLDPQPLTTQEVPVTVTSTSGWMETAQCPAPSIATTTLVGQVVFSWNMFCTVADYARPVVLAMAYLAALFAFVHFARRGD